jgi:hypothetical protein
LLQSNNGILPLPLTFDVCNLFKKDASKGQIITFKNCNIMMEFIFVPLVVWICVSGTYGLFELFARRKERLTIIEKMGDKLDSSLLDGKFNTINMSFKSFSSLKIGCLLAGLGLGLLVGLLITITLYSNDYFTGVDNWRINRYIEVA